jgi:hypothetical protein
MIFHQFGNRAQLAGYLIQALGDQQFGRGHAGAFLSLMYSAQRTICTVLPLIDSTTRMCSNGKRLQSSRRCWQTMHMLPFGW